jgi:hypothetical protein
MSRKDSDLGFAHLREPYAANAPDEEPKRIQVRVRIGEYRFDLLPKCPTARPSIATVGILFVLSF